MPLVDRASKTDLGLITSDQHQVFGRFSGTVVTDSRETLHIKNLIGFAEMVHNLGEGARRLGRRALDLVQLGLTFFLGSRKDRAYSRKPSTPSSLRFFSRSCRSKMKSWISSRSMSAVDATLPCLRRKSM